MYLIRISRENIKILVQESAAMRNYYFQWMAPARLLWCLWQAGSFPVYWTISRQVCVCYLIPIFEDTFITQKLPIFTIYK